MGAWGFMQALLTVECGQEDKSIIQCNNVLSNSLKEASKRAVHCREQASMHYSWFISRVTCFLDTNPTPISSPANSYHDLRPTGQNTRP